MKILTLGGATRDIFIEHKVQATTINNVSCIIFPEGKKIEVSALHYTTGGGATNNVFGGHNNKTLFITGPIDKLTSLKMNVRGVEKF